MVAVAGDNDLCRIGAHRLAVHPEHGFIAADFRPEEKRPAGQFFRNGVLCFEPAVNAFTAPHIPGIDRGVLNVGYGMILFGRFELFAGERADFFKNHGVERFTQTLQLGNTALDLNGVEHEIPTFLRFPCSDRYIIAEIDDENKSVSVKKPNVMRLLTSYAAGKPAGHQRA